MSSGSLLETGEGGAEQKIAKRQHNWVKVAGRWLVSVAAVDGELDKAIFEIEMRLRVTLADKSPSQTSSLLLGIWGCHAIEH